MKKKLSMAFIVVAIMSLALAVSPVFGGNGNGQQGLERTIAAQEKHTGELLAKEGVVGTAVGLNPAGKVAVLVFTAKGGVGNIPNELDSVPVAVRVTGEFVALGGPLPPVASFNVSCNGLSCHFDGSGSTGRKLGFEWDFENDGFIDATGAQVNNVYGGTDDYTVLLRVTDGKDDRDDETTQSFTVVDEGGNTTPTPTPTPAPAPIDPTGRFDRPVPIGVPTAHPDITAGTFGARVKDSDGNIYALTNNHVDADENRASIGDKVLQPGAFDGGTDSSDIIGTLSAFEPIVFSTSANNRIDAAIASSSLANLGNATPSDGYGTPSSTTVPVSELFFRQTVLKYGRTTGFTSGNLDAINATVNVAYDTGTARFVGQIIVKGRGFLAGGDSGSLLVTESNGPIGLLFAGSNGGPGYAMANQIDDVLSALGVSIDDDP